MGFNATLTFPRVDALAKRVAELGTGAFMFKIDFSRYFCQLPIDPGDYSLLCFSWKGEVYFDKVSPQGLRSAPFFAQCTSNAISIGGSRGGVPGARPPWDPILSFLHTFSLKSAHVGGPHPS